MSYINREFMRFIIVGGINTVTYYSIYLSCLHIFQFHYFLSHAIGFTISLIGSFFLNSYFTYKIKPTLVKFIKFPLTQVVNTLASTTILFILIEWLGINSSFAPLIAVIFTIPITFIITGRILKPS